MPPAKKSTSPSARLVVESAGVVRSLTLNRPERRNGLDPEMVRQLAQELERAGRDASVRAVLLRGAGGHFCVGLDLQWFSGVPQPVSDAAFREHVKAFQDAVRAIIDCPVPVVAVLEGSVAGFGLDMALACDLRIASETLTISSAFARIGLVPDGGSTFTLPRLVGLANAIDIAVGGRIVDAPHARRIGLATSVHTPDRIESEAAAFAQGVAAQARSSLAKIKQLSWVAHRDKLEHHLALEAEAQLQALRSQEFRARLDAFLGDKRK